MARARRVFSSQELLSNFLIANMVVMVLGDRASKSSRTKLLPLLTMITTTVEMRRSNMRLSTTHAHLQFSKQD